MQNAFHSSFGVAKVLTVSALLKGPSPVSSEALGILLAMNSVKIKRKLNPADIQRHRVHIPRSKREE